MYSTEKGRDPGKRVVRVAPIVQDQVVRRFAEELMLSEFDKLTDAPSSTESLGDEGPKYRLHRLIRFLGGLFHLKLVSNDSERRVFSVALSDDPPAILADTFALGVQQGYFHRTTIGNKDGTGRASMYVLTRRLAPYFTLDPTSFAGYVFMSSAKIIEGMNDPERFLRRLQDKTEHEMESHQLILFE
jgi:hypothetical protein